MIIVALCSTYDSQEISVLIFIVINHTGAITFKSYCVLQGSFDYFTRFALSDKSNNNVGLVRYCYAYVIRK